MGQSSPTGGTMPAWTYLLLSEDGEVYLGATTNLRQRLRVHNDVKHRRNRRYTFGRRWHLLAAVKFDTRSEAFSCERELKRLPHRKIVWKLQYIARAIKIAERHGYDFDPGKWREKHSPRYVKAAERAKVPLPFLLFLP